MCTLNIGIIKDNLHIITTHNIRVILRKRNQQLIAWFWNQIQCCFKHFFTFLIMPTSCKHTNIWASGIAYYKTLCTNILKLLPSYSYASYKVSWNLNPPFILNRNKLLKHTVNENTCLTWTLFYLIDVTLLMLHTKNRWKGLKLIFISYKFCFELFVHWSLLNKINSILFVLLVFSLWYWNHYIVHYTAFRVLLDYLFLTLCFNDMS